MNPDTSLEGVYQRHVSRKERAITAHLPRLRALATGQSLAIEFGVKHGASSSALLLGAQRVISYDIIETPDARRLQMIAGDRWSYRIMDSRVAPPEICDLLFIDSLHTYAQAHAELRRHADLVSRYLVCHDSITFGSIGADGETGQWLWTPTPGQSMQSVPQGALGIRPAIDQLMIRDSTWKILIHHTDSHGLLVLARQ